MEKAPDGDGGGSCGEGSEPLTYKTWILRVSIHCGGCKKKVKKVLQNIEGVYKIEIDSKQHKVVVTGNVESGTLIKKLIRSGKNAEIWTENGDETAAGDGGEKKMDQSDGLKKDNGGESSGDDHAEEKGGGQAAAAHGGGGGGGGGGKKKKKKKKKKKGNVGPANIGGGAFPPPAAGGGDGSPPPAAAAAGGHVDQTNENAPRQQIFTYPQFYYPAAAEYGMSYNNAPPTASTAASYYTLPMYNYTYLSPRCYPTHLSSEDDHRRDDETSCSIM